MPKLARLLAVVATCCALAASLVSVPAASAADAAFPRTLGLYLAHNPLPSAQTLARYDVVVIDNEWAHRDPATLAQARALNPNLKLLAYVNVIDRPNSLGARDWWSNRYDLWGYTSAGSLGTFPESWIAKTAGGATVSEWGAPR